MNAKRMLNQKFVLKFSYRLLLGVCLVAVGQPSAWGAMATSASVNATEDSAGATSAWGKSQRERLSLAVK